MSNNEQAVNLEPETPIQRTIRRIKEEPLVPIGTLATCVALVMAAANLQKGNSKTMNYWLRARVVFQGLTIGAVVGGTYYYGRAGSQVQAKKEEEARREEFERYKEKMAFEERLKEAENTQRMEDAAEETKKGPFGVWGGSSSSSASPASPSEGSISSSAKGGFWSLLGWGGSSSNKE
ncbi:RCF1 family protein [Abortiporus biennis]